MFAVETFAVLEDDIVISHLINDTRGILRFRTNRKRFLLHVIPTRRMS